MVIPSAQIRTGSRSLGAVFVESLGLVATKGVRILKSTLNWATVGYDATSGVGYNWHMPAPTFHITISGSVVAAYAAVVSTITGAVQLSNFLRDRARIKVSVRRNMQIVGDPRYDGKTLTLIYVANTGRRPVTITTVGAQRLYAHNHIVVPNCNPALPHDSRKARA